jgi:hypothetical protein
VCLQENGRHWTIVHLWLPAEEQARRRWFSEDEAIAWLKRRLKDIDEQ